MFRSAYSKNSKRPINCSGNSRTKQSFKTECDINHLLARYQKTGLLAHVNHHQGNYENISSVSDYHTAMNVVIEAKNSFETLPSNLRARFENNPALFLDFVSNPDNKKEMENLGLIPSQPTEIPTPEPVPNTAQNSPPETPAAKPVETP